MKLLLSKLIFGSLFVLLLPAILYFWAYNTSAIISLPLPPHHAIGNILWGIGICMIIVAMLQLWFQGKGLPMNAFPPQQMVRSGLYAIVPHPIYVGAVLTGFGMSWALESASGFWLVSPFFSLMCLAYVYGFEKEQIVKNFGQQQHKILFDFPAKQPASLNTTDRILAALMVFVPWCILYESFIYVGTPKDAVSLAFSFEARLPYIPYLIIAYTLTYPFAVLIPFVIKEKNVLIQFIISSWLLTLCGVISFLLFPVITPQPAIIPLSIFDNWVLFEQTNDGITAAFPSFHVIWALMGAYYFSKSFPTYRTFYYSLAILIILSCLFLKMHTIADIVFAIALYLVFNNYSTSFARFQTFTEHIANSWKEWHIGNMRLINHGFYGGLAGFAGTMMMAIVLPEHLAFAGFSLGFSAIIGAALWAQLVEGSPLLLRPFGYYGSILGVFCCAIFFVAFTSSSLWLLLSSASLAAPWVQVVGRFRCLVQGCCHGKPTQSSWGICFRQTNSRVNKISGLLGKPLHPTQLYSIIANMFIGLLLIRMVSLEMPQTFLVGLYLILNGLARFVEEAYRGESQTPYWKGMRLYQWIAILNILIGIVFTCIPCAETLSFHLYPNSWIWASALAVFAIFAYGVDFPKSNKPFARLTS